MSILAELGRSKEKFQNGVVSRCQYHKLPISQIEDNHSLSCFKCLVEAEVAQVCQLLLP